MEKRRKKKYVSPAEQMGGVAMYTCTNEYEPPVGPGSKSLPPAGSFRDRENAAVRGLMKATKRRK